MPRFVAIEDIYVGPGACAHRVGDEVPAANVKANRWDDKVRIVADEVKADEKK